MMSEIEPLPSEKLLHELEPTAGQLLEKHLSASKEWFPHQMVPWSRGQDFDAEWEWDPSQAELDEPTRSALFVNLLTEDNLPYYFRTIERMFGADSAWGTWARRWTAEEGRHSIVMRDYLTVTRAIDPIELERARMAQVEGGVVPEPETAHDGFVYVALQELATRIAHFNTGDRIEDKIGKRIMHKVASDENRHHLFYREMVAAALEIDPSGMMLALQRQVHDFEMPGTGIKDFGRHALTIAEAGIYDMKIHHEKILDPIVVKYWGVENVTGLSDEAERARDAMLKRIERIGKAGVAFANRVQRRNQTAEANA